jgi:trk system potassium uptake protein TrkH
MFRLQVLAATARVQMARLLRPHAVNVVYYNRRPVPETVMDAVMGFFYLYILSFVLIAIMLGLSGLDFITALSGAGHVYQQCRPRFG